MKHETKRLIIDIVALFFIMLIFGTDTYKLMVAPIQLILLKMVLLNIGIVHAHLVRKRMFPSVDWTKPRTGGADVAIALYVVIPICYAFGG